MARSVSKRWRWVRGLPLLAAAAFACSSGETGGDSGANQAPTHVCVPGVTQECLCGGGVNGVQACREDGMGFTQCVCPDGGSTGGTGGDASTPDTSAGGTGEEDSSVGGGDTGGSAGTSGAGATSGDGGGTAGTGGAAGSGATGPDDNSEFPTPTEGLGGAAKFGERLGYYRNVFAYSNGKFGKQHQCTDSWEPDFAEDYGYDLACQLSSGACGHSLALRTDYGSAFQCVEFVRRFIGERYHGGDASQVPCLGNGVAYWTTVDAYFDQRMENGATTEEPMPDDIIVFRQDPWDTTGHVAVVRDKTPDTVYIIQQNVTGTTADAKYPLAMTKSGGIVTLTNAGAGLEAFSVLGWIRHSANDPMDCSNDSWCPDGYQCISGHCELGGSGNCGDGVITASEKCDGDLLNNFTCATLDPIKWSTHGSLSCAPGCQDFDTSGCCLRHGMKKCAGNKLYWYDLCDNQEDLADDCGGYGCNTAINECYPPPNCPNGTINPPVEECEGTNLGGQSCATIGAGFTGGTLTCTANCRFDTSLCCTPNCTNKCGGVADGCGGVGTCNSACGAGAVCSTGTCVPCGGTGLTCCAGDQCNNFALTCSYGTCVSCGGLSEPCCGGDQCLDSGTYCSAGSCVSCPANFCQINGHPNGTYCDSGKAVTCTTDGNGCYVATTQTCGTGTYCSGGACVNCAANFCQSNGYSSGQYCNNAIPVTCGVDSNGCYTATSGQACSGGTYCSGGSCTACPPNFCQTNSHPSGSYCDNGVPVTCSTDATNCFVTTQGTACGVGKYCSAGVCVNCPVGYCQTYNHPSGSYCNASSPVTCSTDNNGCYATTTSAACGTGTYCYNGSCASCPGGWCQTNNHGSGSYCAGTSTYTCSTDANGCYITSGQTCGTGTYCTGGSCLSCPTGYCQSNGYSSGSFCYNGTPVTCTTDTNGCYATSTGAACGSGSYCQNGSCLSCPGGWCQTNNHGSGSYCEGSGAYSCSTDANGCYITSGQTCGTGTYCSGGSCVSCSSGWCQINNLPSGQYCNSNTAVTCSTDANGCYATSSSTCTSGTSYCNNGSCVSCASNWCLNNNHGSGSYCSSSTAYTCSTDGNGCYITTSTQSCGTCGCSGTSCVPTPADYWTPTSQSETDSVGQQATQTIAVGVRIDIRPASDGGLEARVCKTSGTFTENIYLRFKDYFGSPSASYSGTLTTLGLSCSSYVQFSGDTTYTSGQVVEGYWTVVSPSTSASAWGTTAGYCTNSGGSGTCWNGINPTFTRTCK